MDPNYIGCTVKTLPPDQRVAAAQRAIEINPANRAPVEHLAAFGLSPEHLALLHSRYWGSKGVRLTVGFMDGAAADLRARILLHANAWGKFSNVTFVESNTSPQVRIARVPGQGYYSYLGTDILGIPANQQTLNLDSFTMSTPDSEFYRVVRHEIGHTLGFPHEHLRKEIVQRIDVQRAIAFFGQTQGWSPQDVMAQVLTPMDESTLIATPNADTRSIMCYDLPASIMRDGVAVPGGTDIDDSDKQLAAKVYPLAVVPPPPPPPPVSPNLIADIDVFFAAIENAFNANPTFVAVLKGLNFAIDAAVRQWLQPKHGAAMTTTLPPWVISAVEATFEVAEQMLPQYAPVLRVIEQLVVGYLISGRALDASMFRAA